MNRQGGRQERSRLRRWWADRRVRAALAVAVAVAAFLVIRESVPEVDLQELLSDVSHTLGDWTYVLVAVFAFLETGAFVGLVAPGETVVIVGGAVAGQGATSLYLTIGLVWAAAWAGDSVSFLIGRKLGRGFILRHGPRFRITRQRFATVEGYFSRHGGKTVLVGRFIGLVRALAPFIAGSSGMRYLQFAPFSVLGTGLWAAIFALLGYFLSQSIDRAADVAGQGTLLFAIVVGAIVATVVAARFLRVPDNRRRLVGEMERRAALRPLVSLGRRMRPQARFLWGRITPGGLGLELTALLAAASVGLFVLVAYAVEIGADPGATAGDRAALDVVRSLRTEWLTEAARALTELGSQVVVLPVAVIAGVLLAARRRWAELAILGAALAITLGAVSEMKEAFDRPRPEGSLTDAGSPAFPSGHAAYSVLYAWVALTLAVRLRPGITGGTALVIAGIALTAVVGLTRMYLGVHYLSDVLAGWGLAVAAFALCGAVAVVAAHLRQNSTGAPDGEHPS